MHVVVLFRGFVLVFGSVVVCILDELELCTRVRFSGDFSIQSTGEDKPLLRFRSIQSTGEDQHS